MDQVNAAVLDGNKKDQPIDVGNIHDLTNAIQVNYFSNDNTPLYVADVGRNELWDAYLGAFPESERQEHNCSCCRRWFRKMGHVIKIDPTTGEQTSAIFDHIDKIPAKYLPSIIAVKTVLAKARARSIFDPKDTRIGVSTAGGFNHFYTNVVRRKTRYMHGREINADTVREERRLLAEGLGKYTLEQLKSAKVFFQNDAQLKYAEPQIAALTFAINAKELVSSIRDHDLRNNLLLRLADTNPTGHVRFAKTVVGNFLDAESYEVGKANFLEQTKGENYLRPKAAPTAGAVQNAERLFQELNLGPALARRSLRRDELPQEVFIWKPMPEEQVQPQEGNLFGHLKTKDTASAVKKDLPVIQVGKMTWEKFVQTYLGKATVIQVNLPHALMPYSLLTAADPDAQPILSWDKENKRNPVSPYRYVNAHTPQQWSTKPGFVDVFGLVPWPEDWNRAERDGTCMMVLKEGFDPQDQGTALFPQILRHELHAVRSVIEAYSSTAMKQGREQGLMAISIGKGNLNMQIRVTTDEAVLEIVIDRFE